VLLGYVVRVGMGEFMLCVHGVRTCVRTVSLPVFVFNYRKTHHS
jgi:hypothetical protein